MSVSLVRYTLLLINVPNNKPVNLNPKMKLATIWNPLLNPFSYAVGHHHLNGGETVSSDVHTYAATAEFQMCFVIDREVGISKKKC